LSLFNFKKCKF